MTRYAGWSGGIVLLVIALVGGCAVHESLSGPAKARIDLPDGSVYAGEVTQVQPPRTAAPKPAAIQSGQAALEPIATLPSVDRVEALKVLAGRPNEVVVCTQNVGANCGGGTPATIWKLTLDQSSCGNHRLDRKQSLDQVQNTRQTLFQASDGTLFTGGGWCLFKPPYYSTDLGETWKPATGGTYPPNSTFFLAEFKGRVYAGTGYEPHHAQVYRWLGEGAWERVFDIVPPRSISAAMAAYGGQLFVGANVYWAGAKSGGTPIYVSSDGNQFSPTEGLADTYTAVIAILPAGDDLFALVAGPEGSEMVHWNGKRWEPWAKVAIETSARPVVSAKGMIYIAGKMADKQGVFATGDGGKTWRDAGPTLPQIPYTIDVSGTKLFVGTVADADHRAYVYAIDIAACERATVK